MKKIPCETCGSLNTRSHKDMERFPFTVGEKTVSLSHIVTIWTCDDCGDEFTADDAEDSRKAVINAYFRSLQGQ